MTSYNTRYLAGNQRKPYPHPLMAGPTALLAVGWLLPMMAIGSLFSAVTALPAPRAPIIKHKETLVV